MDFWDLNPGGWFVKVYIVFVNNDESGLDWGGDEM